MATTEVVIAGSQVPVAARDFMPVFDIGLAVERRNAMVQFVQQIMVPGTDFGTIPGTGDKKVLLKAGAEKLCSFFGLSPEFILVDHAEDWSGAEHKGEAFFYYLYRCRLTRNGRIVGEGDGSCNSWESRYRWRKKERTCPSCGAEAIIRGKKEYGGGYLCFTKKGGCNAKFKDGDPAIEQQETGRVPNPDIADVVNTIQKMSQKRALVAAVLIGVNASDYFTQDIEDLQVIDVPPGETQEQVAERRIAEEQAKYEAEQRRPATVQQRPVQQQPVVEDPEPLRAMFAQLTQGKFEKLKPFQQLKRDLHELSGEDINYYAILQRHGVEKSDQFKSLAQAKACLRDLYNMAVSFESSGLVVSQDDVQQGQLIDIHEQEAVPYAD